MITIQNAESVLKSYYLEAVSKQLNDNVSPFMAAIEKTSENINGKDVKLTMATSFGQGVVACGEDDDLPEANTNVYKTYTIPLKNIYGTIEISDKTLRAARASADALVDVLDLEMNTLVTDAKQKLDRMVHGDHFGAVARITKSDSSTTVTVLEAHLLKVGMVVDIIDTNGAVVSGGSANTITAISGKTVTFANAFVVGSSTLSMLTLHNSYNKELCGLYDLFFTPTVYGEDRNSSVYLKPKYFSIAKDAFTEDYFLQCLDEVSATGTAVNMIVCSYATRRLIYKWLSANHCATNTKVLEGGFEAITYNGIPVVADVNCSDNFIYIINTDDFRLYQLCDWEWMEDEDGKILHRVPGKAAYSTTLVKYAELVCTRLYGQGAIRVV